MQQRTAPPVAAALVAVLAAALVAAVQLPAAAPPAFAASRALRPAQSAPVVAPASSPAFALDAPDPDVIRFGSMYYAYTTGTTWGNNLGVLESASPSRGFRTINGQTYGSTALPNPPSWQKSGTQTSPGVAYLGGQFVMYYDAVDAASGQYCISVATSPSPAGPFTDDSTAPFLCQAKIGGSIDPSPFVDSSGAVWLDWKSLSGGYPGTSAVIWAEKLSANGLAAASPLQQVQLLVQDSAQYPWEKTIENPDMVLAGGTYDLFYSGGLWDSSGYGVGVATCAGPAGPCTRDQSQPILTSYGDVLGPGAESLFADGSGNWWMAYAAWQGGTAGCTDYSCGGARELFVGSVNLTASPPTARPEVTAISPIGGSPNGGTTVTIAGTGLGDATAVDFGTAPATKVTVVSATEVTATSPAWAGGTSPTLVPVTVVTPGGVSTAASCNDVFSYGVTVPAQTGVVVPLAPSRVADTRPGSGEPYSGQTLAGCSALAVKLGGVGGIPATGVSAAVVNVTAVSSTAGGYLTVYPAGSIRPLASNLNFGPHEAVPNLVEVPFSSDAEIFNGSIAPTNVIVDVEGYVATVSTSGAGYYNALSPARLCDTRNAQRAGETTPCTGDATSPGAFVTVPVAGHGGVPSTGASAVVLDLTAIDPSGPGYLAAYPSGGAVTSVSAVNYRAGQTVPNRVVVPVGKGGDVSIFTSGGFPGIAVDVDGWLSAAGGTGSSLTPRAPVRIADTRPGSGEAYSGDTLQAGTPLTIQVTGTAGVPSGATAVVVNVTVTDPTAGGYLTAYPAGMSQPTASDLNWAPSETVPNLCIVKLSSSGAINIIVSRGNPDIVVDLVGWFH